MSVVNTQAINVPHYIFSEGNVEVRELGSFSFYPESSVAAWPSSGGGSANYPMVSVGTRIVVIQNGVLKAIEPE